MPQKKSFYKNSRKIASSQSYIGQNSNPFQYSDLENSMDCIVHGVAKSWTRLSDFHFTSLQQVQPTLIHIGRKAVEIGWGQMWIFMYVSSYVL